MNKEQKIDCLCLNNIESKDTIWGNEMVVKMCGQSEIEIKILDSKDGPLSIQSHPNSWEIWKILEVEPGAFIIGGLTQEYVRSSNEFYYNQAKGIIRFCNIIFPKVSDVYLIPEGLIHCLGKGIVALEIKPSVNNETIRIYDWGRDREPQTLKCGIRWYDVCDQEKKIIRLT